MIKQTSQPVLIGFGRERRKFHSTPFAHRLTILTMTEKDSKMILSNLAKYRAWSMFASMANLISAEQWAAYDRDGYIKLGKLLNDTDLHALQQRIDDIMLGKARVN